MQHTYDSVLKQIKRGYTSTKIDFYITRDLPGSTVDIDIRTIDQWKLYSCRRVRKKWYKGCNDRQYTHITSVSLMIVIKRMMYSWIRLNRVTRDIPEQYIEVGSSVTNLRQILQRTMKERGLKCRCIDSECKRIGEIKDDKKNSFSFSFR